MIKKIIYVILLILAVFGFSVSCFAQDKKISQLGALPSVNGTELIPVARSGANYYMTPAQLPPYLANLFIPLAGTGVAAPVTGTIEYRGAVATTAFVDTVNTMYIGAGNRKDLSLATTYGRIAFLVSGGVQSIAKGATGQSQLNLLPNSWTGSATNTGTVTTQISMTSQTASVTSTYSLFPGLQYSVDLSSKFRKYSLIDSNFAATHYAPLSYTATPTLAQVLTSGNDGGAVGGITSGATGFGIVSVLPRYTARMSVLSGASPFVRNRIEETWSGGGNYTCELRTDTNRIYIYNDFPSGWNGAMYAIEPTYLGGTLLSKTKGDLLYASSSYSTAAQYATTPLSISSNTISIPAAATAQNGYLTSTDWNTFNNKQAALTNPITGTGTSGQAAFFTGSTTQSSDAKFFWDNTNKFLGVGNNVPVSVLHTAETSTATTRGINSDQYSTNTSGSRITMRKARGTFASPTTIVSGDFLGSWTASGYEGASFIEAAKILVTSAGTIGTNTVPATMALQTATSAGVLTTGLSIDQSQNVAITNTLTAGVVIKSGGTSSQFLKADGSVDANTYLTSSTGVPSSRTITINGTAFDLSANRSWTVGDALVANPLSQFASTTSAQLAATISNETGSGAAVFGTSPTFVTPLLGTPTSGDLTNCTNIPVANATGILLGANGGTGVANTGKTITLGGSIVTTGTSTPTFAFGTTSYTYTPPLVTTKLLGYADGTNTGSGNIFYMSSAGNTTTTARATDDGFMLWDGTFIVVQDKTANGSGGLQTKSNNGGSGKFFSMGGTFATPTGTSINTTSFTAVSSTTGLIFQPTTSAYLTIGTAAGNIGWSGTGAGIRIGRNDNLHTAATAYLTLDASTASAGTGSLKIPAGTLLTTTEAGLFENNGTHAYFTFANSGTRYQLDQQPGNLGGTATNDNATAGNVGEYVESLVAVGSAVSFTTATSMNITSISLTAGDWDVNGQVNYTETVATVSARAASIGSTSATLATDGSEGYCGVQSTLVTEKNSIDLPRKRISVSGTTTVYLIASCTFAAGTAGGFGFINARRVR